MTDVAIAAVGVSKRFGHVEALRDATVMVYPGQITAIFGDNGAGKSTLLRIMCGVYAADEGQVVIGDQPVLLRSIRDAQALGVDVIHQDMALAPDLTVLENIFLGHEVVGTGWKRLLGILSRGHMAQEADAALRRLGIELPSLRVPVGILSGGQRQAVAVARAMMWCRAAVLMDEPTAALGTKQSDIVCRTIQEAAARGLGVLVISHDIPRMLRIADSILVLRRGTIVLTGRGKDMTIPDIVHAMVGDVEVSA